MADKYTPYPTVEPQFKATPSITEKFPEVQISNAVGEALKIVGHGTGVLSEAYKAEGEAWGRLGASAKNAGNELFDRAVAMKQLDIQKEVDDATLKLYNQSSDAVEAHGATLGENAVKGAPAVRKSIMDMRAQIASGLTSEVAKREFNGKTLNIIGSDSRRITEHARQQDLALKKETNQQTINMYIDQASRADNPEEKKRIMDDLDKQIDFGHHLYGRPGNPNENPITINQKREADQKVTADTIHLLSKKNPIEAYRQLQKAYEDGKVSAEVYPQLESTVRRDVTDTGVKIAVSEAWDPKGGLQEMQDKAAKKATEDAIAAGVPEMATDIADKAKQAIDGKFNMQRAAEHDTQVKDTNAFSRSISGKNNTGQWLYTKEELFAQSGNPDKSRAAFDNLPQDTQNRLEAEMRKGPPGGPETPQSRTERNKILYDLQGYGTSDERLKAMEVDPYDPKYNFSRGYADEIRDEIERQDRIGKKAVENPAVRAALSTLDEFAVGSLKNKKSDRYKAVAQEIAARVKIWAAENKRDPDDKAREDIVRKTLRDKDINVQEGSEVAPAPKGYIDAAKKANPGMTEEQINALYDQYLMTTKFKTLMSLTPEQRETELRRQFAVEKKKPKPAIPTPQTTAPPSPTRSIISPDRM
jgi:hypothetical protein